MNVCASDGRLLSMAASTLCAAFRAYMQAYKAWASFTAIVSYNIVCCIRHLRGGICPHRAYSRHSCGTWGPCSSKLDLCIVHWSFADLFNVCSCRDGNHFSAVSVPDGIRHRRCHLTAVQHLFWCVLKNLQLSDHCEVRPLKCRALMPAQVLRP